MSEATMKARTYRAVHHYLARQPVKGPLLDVPCGTGRLSRQLHEAGFPVVSADIASNVVTEPHVTFLQADLNDPLPFQKASFAFVACVEGIEHLENPFHTVRELRRIIQKGGVLIITTPNIQSLGSRLRFLLTGGFNYFRRPYHRGYHGHGVHGHINPLSFYEMMFILSDAGFRIEQVFTDAPRVGSLALFPVWPVLAAATGYFVCLREKNAAQRHENLRLLKYMVSPALVFGRIMMLAARAV